ncbi:UPF0754 membrane protein [Leptospira kobayashii]|uniref:UPF0754 membrane protein n=1 Tax=Leptospira kobayashii TaxID=1917830 RepID=A0ABN6KBU6_9LEPT|nr:DUF445 family protein [Leptospira kobayashii]BDA77739.1 UPF0754 membrane protein [Leptospira kobayashii]
MDIAKIDSWYRKSLVFFSIIAGGFQVYLPDNIWIDACFVILMAGVVGYFTNFLAIKMLFQPKAGKVLGWEGLVPKNKPKIAKSLGESIQNNLLHPDIILAYIYERNLVESGVQKIVKEIDEAIHNDEIREMLVTKIITILKERGPEILEVIFDFSEETIKKMASRPEEIQKLWIYTRNKLMDYLNEQTNREEIGNQLRVVLLEEMPRLANLLNEGLEDYLKTRNTLGKIGIGVKKIFSFNDEAIQELLERFVQDPETSDQFMGMMDEVMARLQERLDSKETQDFITAKISDWLSASGDYARQNLLPNGIERLQSYLDDPSNWEEIEKNFFRAVDWIKNRLVEFMNSEEGKIYLKKNIEKFVHKINVTALVEERVMELDTDDLEKMILDNTGGNLVVIQFLGGILGMIAGLVQVHIYFGIPVGALVGITYIAHYRNKRKQEGDL